MSRAARLVLIALAVLAFLAISIALARILSASGAERGLIRDLLTAQARGDAPAMIADLAGCRSRAACRARQRANAARLRRAGSVKLLRLDPSSRFVLGPSTGVTRVAWTIVGRRPVVQCVGVRRTGNPVTGMGVELTSLSPPVAGEAGC